MSSYTLSVKYVYSLSGRFIHRKPKATTIFPKNKSNLKICLIQYSTRTYTDLLIAQKPNQTNNEMKTKVRIMATIIVDII